MQNAKDKKKQTGEQDKNNISNSKDASIKLTFRPTFVGFNPQSVDVKLTLIVRS